ncbi:hypothetical protein CLIB1444_05S05820 [[Candida] jaroonii]|uniref:Uncharacterized protein n=1 Tax=[Candida] jaroonii TaxID=467808 RepID=A0ACA9Y8P0_9ASCO|nr:hypothetical protein CLIB1444_05S05820 [[Candida] jaroonii]
MNETKKRRKHKNSKFGCPNCKKRRVKCSEDLPQCLNCIKHKVKCGYLDFSPERIEEMKLAKLQEKDEEEGRTRSNSLNPILSNGSGHKSSLTSISGSLKSSLSGPATSMAPSLSGTNNSLQGSFSGPTSAPGSYSGPTSAPSSMPALSSGPSTINPLKTFNSHDLDDEIENLSIGLRPTTHYYNNFNNILNHPNNTISQNFDNLLTATPDKEGIIYPVYSIVGNQGISPFDINNFGFTGLSSTGISSTGMSSAAATPNIDNYYNNYEDDSLQQNLIESLMNSSSVPQDYLINIASPPQIASSKILPNGIKQQFKFKKLKKVEVNYRAVLIDTVIQLGPMISQGTASLIQIRGLYTVWLNSFLYKSYESDLMFSCLINLTTNFLISNIFNNFNLINNNTNNFINITNTKNILLIITIKYYAIVIKGIRIYLNKNFDPELCSFVSYILSLMSIYDPEVSLNSVNCFTDGLFSVLKFNLNQSIKKGITPPILIPVHLKLMENIQKSIYFPGYDPDFLHEYRDMLSTFGAILSKLKLPTELEQYLNKHYSNLWDFTNSSLDEYLPLLIENQDNNQIQQEVLFKMTSTWVRLFPSKLLMINKNSHLMEKVLYIFFKLFKKSLFAIVPQVKYYFLRDFDSPLMLDVFNFLNDNEIFFDDNLNQDYVVKYKDELKVLISYCVRAANYFLKRLQFMYKTVVYESTTKNLFPVPQERKSFIIDIPKFRKLFYETLNIKETHIKSFNTTLIKPYHFPHTEDIEQGEDGIDHVDYLTMKEYGFLAGDVIS